MLLRNLTTNMSGSRRRNGTAETPQLYLNLTTKFMHHVDSMVASPSLKFNHEQCKYLAYKLREAEQSAHLFFEPIKTWYSNFASDEDRARSLEIFKLLFVLGKEVKTFIQGCSKDAWVQSPILLTNASEHTSSLGFDLDLCMIVFSKSKTFGSLPAFTVAEVGSIKNAEDEMVEERSVVDKMRLEWDLITVIQSTRSSSADRQQARFLLGRLRSPRPFFTGDSSESNESTRPDISMRSLKQIQELGRGSSGIVHKAIWLGTEVAMKTFHKLSAPEFEHEVKILEGLCHPNIVSLLWYSRDERKCYMVIELMDGDHSSLMQERLEGRGGSDGPFSISEVLHIMLQVAEGMLFLHEKRIVHRDLKSSNILVRRMKVRDVGVKYLHVKVADFGVSRTKEKSKTYSNQTGNQGTTRWMAPEMMKIVKDDGHVELQREGELRYPFKVDVYSFAMVCFEILTGEIPFGSLSPNEVKMKVLAGERPQLPEKCPDSLRRLIESCWSLNPVERPHFRDICAKLRHLKCAHYMISGWAKTPRCFSLEEIKRMTNKFNKDNLIGCGFASCATVYKGVMSHTGEVVAVKTELNAKNSKDEPANDKFRVQMEVLPRLHHNNVVGYAGFCVEKDVGLLVFEYMPNESLERSLFGPVSLKLMMTWPVRRNICLGVADGIHYLHSLSQPRIVHGYIKPRNILLDQNLEPKVADFSSAHLLPDDEMETKADFVVGTGGHSAPEYFTSGLLSQKVDVYSFGVVLLEVVSGRKCVDRELRIYLPEWARKLHFDGRINELIDPSLDLQAEEEMEAVRIIEIALLCVDYSSERRPDMSVVVSMLQAILDADIISSQLSLDHLRERPGMSRDWPRPSFGSSSRASSLASIDSNWLHCL